MNIRGTDPTALNSAADLFLPSAGRQDDAEKFQRALQPAPLATTPKPAAPRAEQDRHSAEEEHAKNQAKSSSPVSQQSAESAPTIEPSEEDSLAKNAVIPIDKELTDEDLADGDETAQVIAAAQLLTQEQLAKNSPQQNPIPELRRDVEEPINEMATASEGVADQIPSVAAGQAIEGPPIPAIDLEAPTQFDAPSAIPVEPVSAPIALELPREERTSNPPLDSADKKNSEIAVHPSQPVVNHANGLPIQSNSGSDTLASPRKQPDVTDPSVATADAPAVLPSTTADSSSHNDRESAEDPPGMQRPLTERLEDTATMATEVAPAPPGSPATTNELIAGNIPAPSSPEPAAPQPTNQNPAIGSTPPINTAAAIIQRLPAHALVRNDTSSQPEGAPVQIDSARFLQRVARAFESARERGGEIRLRLSPPELGALRMEVTMQEQGLVARVEVETPEARAALMDNLPLLRERLAEQNLRLERFEVNLAQRDSSQRGSEFADHNSERQPQSSTRQPRNPVTRQPTVPTVITPVATPVGIQDRRLNVIV